MKLFILSGLCLLLACPYAADWPQFKQTPNRYGCSLGETIALPGKLCLWADFGSPIFAPPTIVDNKTYAIASNGLLACIDLQTNLVVWKTKLGGINNESTPSVKGGKVYVGTKDGLFQVLDASTGAILKTYNAGGPIFASPLLLDSGVYFGSFDSTFHALDLDGNFKWKQTASVNIIHAACYYDSTIVFVDGGAKLFWAKESAGTGVVRMAQLSYGGDPQAILCPPVVWRDTIFTARDYTELGDPGIWTYSFLTGAAIARKIGTSLSQVRACISVDTSTGFLYSGSSWDGFFAVNKWKTVPATETHPPKGLYRSNTSPAVTGNCVVFGTEEGLVCFYGKATGNATWSYATPSAKPISSSPAVSNGRTIIGSTDGCLYGFWDGTEVTTPQILQGVGTEQRNRQVAGEWTLTVFPNPARTGSIQIGIQGLPEKSVIGIYSISGQILASFGNSNTADKTISWNGCDRQGKPLAAGHYLGRVTNAGRLLTMFKMQIIR